MSSPSAPITIRSPRLAVEIAAPGTVYQRTRFDWAGFVTQVTLDGRHTFCAPEDYDPQKGSGGIGLCNEFGIEKMLGYDEAAAGELFPKLGIGLLRKPDDAPYNFFRAYEIAEPFPIQTECTENEARFTVEPIECRGYAAREIKTLRVADDRLEIAYRLENTGRRAIHTHEYCHNFVGVDQQPVGSQYCLHFPYPLTFEENKFNFEALQIEGNMMRWPQTPQMSFYCRPVGYQQSNQPQWQLTVSPEDITMSETDDFTPARVAVWGAAHVFSAEVFIDLDLEPGETITWMRSYRFTG